MKMGIPLKLGGRECELTTWKRGKFRAAVGTEFLSPYPPHTIPTAGLGKLECKNPFPVISGCKYVARCNSATTATCMAGKVKH